MQPFWQQKSLTEMTDQEWESLCDGCGRCCLQKLQDEDSGAIVYTNIVCQYIDNDSCRCGDYANRSTLVPTCIHLTPDNVHDLHWLPNTCAYRLLAEGKELQWWHPLVSGSPDTVHEAGISVRNKCISDSHVHPDDWEEHVIRWVEI